VMNVDVKFLGSSVRTSGSQHRPAPRPTRPPVTGPFPEGKASGAWCWPPTSFSRQVANELELHLRLPSGSVQACHGMILGHFEGLK
jgi:hypothetical protein